MTEHAAARERRTLLYRRMALLAGSLDDGTWNAGVRELVQGWLDEITAALGCPCCAGHAFLGDNPLVGCRRDDCGHFMEAHQVERPALGLAPYGAGRVPVVPHPARLAPAYVAALRRRYAATAAGGDVVARYGAACDLVVQLFWADRYGTDPEDPLLHTSDQARTVAALFCEVLGIDLAAAVRALDAEDEAR